MTQINKQRFSHNEIAKAINGTDTIAKAAKALGRKGRGDVKVQELREWLTQMDTTTLADGFDRAKELARSRNSQVENNKLRKDVRSLVDQLGNKQAFLDAMYGIIDILPRKKRINKLKHIGPVKGTAVTVEVLLSDLQIGKRSPGYNTPVAFNRLKEYGRAVLFQIQTKIDAGYKVERIVLALLGDIIESDKKHANSARATDTGTSEQIFDSIKGILEYVIEPLAHLRIPVEVECITGNHDWDDHGLNMFEPGKQQLSWPLYKSLELICNRSGLTNVKFNIPEGSYTVNSFYGQHVLYEHGVGVSVTEASMKAHKVKRAEQEKKHLSYFRMGDKHTVTMFNSGQMVVNGAFFGAKPGGTEYSGIAGYSSVPAQWMGFHVARKDNRLSLYDSFVIQLDHIGE